MEFLIEPRNADVSYRAVFSKPMLENAIDKERTEFVGNLMALFDVHLNDIRFNSMRPGDELIHFSRFFDSSFFDLSYGLEEVKAVLRNPLSEGQLLDLIGKLGTVFRGVEFKTQNVLLQQHFELLGDLKDFFASQGMRVPNGFVEGLTEQMLGYGLRFEEEGLTLRFVLSSSLFVTGGIFLNFECDFTPNRFDISGAYDFAKKQLFSSLGQVGLKLKEG